MSTPINHEMGVMVGETESALNKDGIALNIKTDAFQAGFLMMGIAVVGSQLMRIADALEKANDIKMGINS